MAKKMSKFGICGEVFDKVCTFWQTKTSSDNHASKLFWQDFSL